MTEASKASEGRPSGGMRLERLLAETTEALARLDAASIEALAESLDRADELLELPSSVVEWERVRSRHWVLGHLLGETAGRLAMLGRVSDHAARCGA